MHIILTREPNRSTVIRDVILMIVHISSVLKMSGRTVLFLQKDPHEDPLSPQRTCVKYCVFESWKVLFLN